MLSLNEPLELYFSIYCTGQCASKQFGVPAPIESYSDTKTSGSVAATSMASLHSGERKTSSDGTTTNDNQKTKSARNGFFLSEEYSIQVTAQGTPSDIDMMGKLGTLFQNIEKLEISNGLHLVCRVYRVGALELAPPG